jgi:hypothetical protein
MKKNPKKSTLKNLLIPSDKRESDEDFKKRCELADKYIQSEEFNMFKTNTAILNQYIIIPSHN